MSTLLRQGWRFLLVGGSNTLISFTLLAILAHFIDARIAYTIAFVVGLTYATALTGRLVFSSVGSRRRTIAFVAWYLCVYLIGLLVVHLIESHGDHSALLISLIAIAVTAPLGFLGGRLIYHRPLATVDPEPAGPP